MPRTPSRPLVALRLLAAVAVGAASFPLVVGAPAHAAAPPAYTVVKDLHFRVTGEGPAHDTTCEVEGDLYTPTSASVAHPVPAILTTNGFGGSKNDQAGDAETEASRGYVVLSYSGLGFGAPAPGSSSPDVGSGCSIEINDPDWDGIAGKALISWLGGADGIGFRSYDKTAQTYSDPISEHDVVLDDHDHAGHSGAADPHDPRVGMIGGSEGGEVQFAVAGVDPRLDVIIPQITWNDLAYSLGPNNTTLPPNSVSYTTAGVLKLDWPVLFSALGTADGVEKIATSPIQLTADTGCTGFDRQVCTALATSASLGYPPYDDAVGAASPSLDTVDFLRHRSVTTYMKQIHIPVLLSQGQADTLFELSEAVANFEALKAQGNTVHMIWQEWGHSGPAVEGENILGDAGSPDGGLYQAWFDHYLKGESTDLGPTFTYFRDWAYAPGSKTGAAAEPAAKAAYASSDTYPVAPGVTYSLSGASSPTGTPGALTSGTPTAGSSSFVAPAVVGASYTETSAIDQTAPVTDAPGTFAAFDLPAYAKPTDVVGIPTATLHLTAPAATSAAGPVDELVLFLRLEDVAPDDTVTLPHRLVAAFRAPDLSKPVTVRLPGVVHQVAAGHHLRLVVAGSDLAFHGNGIAQPVTLTTGPGAAASTLTVPILGATTSTPPATTTVVAPVGGTAPTGPTATSAGGGALATTGLDAAVPVAALVALGGALLLRRAARRR